MELIERYLKSIRRLLPPGQPDDIINELRSNILSQIDDREAGLGRALTDGEREAILKQHGDPLEVAARYRSDERCLAFGRQWIGPVLFPFYEKVLLINLSITAIIISGIGIVLAAGGSPLDFGQTWRAFLVHGLVQFGIVTAIFIAAQRSFARNPGLWNPCSAAPRGAETATGDVQRIPRLVSISEIIGIGVFLAWLQAVQSWPFLIFGPGAEYFRLGPAWFQLYPPMVILAVARMFQAGINVARPEWVRFQAVVRIGSGLVWLFILFLLLQPDNWVVPGNPGKLPFEDYRGLVALVNQCFFYGWLIFGLFAAWDTIIEVRRFLRLTRHAKLAQA